MAPVDVMMKRAQQAAKGKQWTAAQPNMWALSSPPYLQSSDTQPSAHMYLLVCGTPLLLV